VSDDRFLIRIYAADITAFKELNASLSHPLDLSDEIESRASTTHHLFQYAVAVTKENLAAFGQLLKKLVPSLRKELRFERDGEIFTATNFNSADDVIRIHKAFMKHNVQAAKATKNEGTTVKRTSARKSHRKKSAGRNSNA
jgi:hypothetical protein